MYAFFVNKRPNKEPDYSLFKLDNFMPFFFSLYHWNKTMAYRRALNWSHDCKPIPKVKDVCTQFSWTIPGVNGILNRTRTTDLCPGTLWTEHGEQCSFCIDQSSCVSSNFSFSLAFYVQQFKTLREIFHKYPKPDFCNQPDAEARSWPWAQGGVSSQGSAGLESEHPPPWEQLPICSSWPSTPTAMLSYVV